MPQKIIFNRANNSLKKGIPRRRITKIEKISKNLTSSKYFPKNGHFLSRAADCFCLFIVNVRQNQHLLIFESFRKQFLQKGENVFEKMRKQKCSFQPKLVFLLGYLLHWYSGIQCSETAQYWIWNAKGTVSRDFRLLVFFMNQLPTPLSIPLGPFRMFFENSWRYLQLMVHHRCR
jgi:hypothetical protein